MAIKNLFICLISFTLLFPCLGCKDNTNIQQEHSAPTEVESTPVEPSAEGKIHVTVLQSWSGDYPVKQLALLPADQRESPVGYINDTEMFAALWKHFMPSEELPVVDFDKNMVVFSRNVQFYNRTNIFKVELENGTAEILAMETMSAIPIEDRVAMAMAVIPREGVKAIKARDGVIEVE